jgi:hypothetical protein
MVSQRKQNPFVVRAIVRRKVMEMSPRWVRGRNAEGTILGEVWWLVEIAVSSVKTEVCDF